MEQMVARAYARSQVRVLKFIQVMHKKILRDGADGSSSGS